MRRRENALPERAAGAVGRYLTVLRSSPARVM